MDKTINEKQYNNIKVLNSFKYNFADIIFKEVFQLIVKLGLARLLLPEDFGLIGMAVIFTGFFNTISELGFGSALIQKSNTKLNNIYYSTTFTVNLLINIFIYILIFFPVSSFVSQFYNNDDLIILLRVLALPLLINSFIVVNRVKLISNLNFKILTYAGITSSIVSGIVAILLALNGFGYWSLAIQTVLSSIIYTSIVFAFSKWRISFKFSIKIFNELFNFGIFISLYNIASFLTKNVDYFIIGKILGERELGIYTIAFLLTDTFRSRLMDVSNKVLFPAMSKLQNNIKQVKNYYSKSIAFNSILIVPTMLFEIIYAKEIIILMFGDNWASAIVPLQIISLAVIIHVTGGSTGAVFKSLGYAKKEFIIYSIKTLVVTVPIIIILTHLYGINGSALGVLTHKIIGRIIYYMYVNRMINIKIINIYNALKKTIIASVIMIIPLLIYKNLVNVTNIYLLISIIPIGFITYVVSYIKLGLKMKIRDLISIMMDLIYKKENIDVLLKLL